MRLVFPPAKLILEKAQDGEYRLKLDGNLIATFTKEKAAVNEYNKIRRKLEAELPPAQISDEEKQQLLQKSISDSLVAHNSMRAEPRRKAAKSRTFG
jgi:hypothetical protein